MIMLMIGSSNLLPGAHHPGNRKLSRGSREAQLMSTSQLEAHGVYLCLSLTVQFSSFPPNAAGSVHETFSPHAPHEIIHS